MKTILFFDRCELTELYASLSLRMKDEFHILHIAYSSHEKKILLDKYGIKPDYVFQDLVADKLKEDIDLNIICEADLLIINESNERFNLNSSIQSDRGFSLLSYKDALLLAQSQYKVWKEIFDKYDIDFFYHEPPSLFMNHIASFLCLARNARYCYDSMIKGENTYNYILLMQDTAYSPEINAHMMSLTEQDVADSIERIRTFLLGYRESYNIFLGDKIKSNTSYFSLLKPAISSYLKYQLKRDKVDILKDNIDYYLLKNNDYLNKFSNLINYKFRIKFEDLDIKCSYYYYSMNLEPEATVLYLGDGIYENQVKLIANIASQLPPDTYLYVKDHPHFIGYRDYKDYLKLMSVPNIKVLKAEIPGKVIIKNCIGVFIVNGTAGFEAILLNKHVYTFGNMFFNVCDRVNYIKNIKDLRNILYKNHNVVYEDDFHLHKFVLAFLNSTHVGVTDFFQGRIGLYDIDYDENINMIANDLSVFFKAYEA